MLSGSLSSTSLGGGGDGGGGEFSGGGGETDEAAAADVMRAESNIRRRASSKGQMGAQEGWKGYRTRTMGSMRPGASLAPPMVEA